jgi:hypothetical protein
MLFYLVMGSMFSLYAADLLFLVIVATIARSRDAYTKLQRWVPGCRGRGQGGV